MPTTTSCQQLTVGYYLINPTNAEITNGPFATEGLAAAAITGLPNTGTHILKIVAAPGVLVQWAAGSVFGTVQANVTAA